MVLIVVFVHAVAADKVKCRESRTQGITNDLDVTLVVVVVYRISFGLANDAAVNDIGGIGKLDATASMIQVTDTTRAAYLKETGLGSGSFKYLGHIMGIYIIYIEAYNTINIFWIAVAFSVLDAFKLF